MAPFDPNPIRVLAQAGDIDAARAVLLKVQAHLSAPTDRWAWALVALELGEVDHAASELQLAAEAAPRDTRIRRAIAQLDEWSDLPDAPPAAATPEPTRPMPGMPVTDADVMSFVHTFAGREGVHARQWVRRERDVLRVGYAPVQAPLTPTLARAHLAGKITLGSYPIRQDGTVTWAVVDIDLTRKALDAARTHADVAQMRAALATATHQARDQLDALGLPTMTIDSGYKGRHLWLLFAQPLPGDLVHRFGRELLRALNPPALVHLEFFPKQGRVAEDGLGNLVKLPLGVHLRTGKRCVLLDRAGEPATDQWAAIRTGPRIDQAQMIAAFAQLRPPPITVADPPTPDQSPTPTVRSVIDGCPVLAGIIGRAHTRKRLSHDECIVLVHSLGHLPGGADAVNLLFSGCPEVPPHLYLKRGLAGCPISCARIRARVPEITAHVACHCAFTHPSHYPSPVLHAHADAVLPLGGA